MTATTGEQLLNDYLARLRAAALRLPPDRRADLMEGIAEHVAAARAADELRDEAAVRTLLDRLGQPDEIVAAAREDAPGGESRSGWGPPRWNPPPSAAPPVPTPPGTGLEAAAVLMLTAGSLLPVVGWLVGVALLWTSRRWRTSEKLLGTLVVPGGPGILLPLSGFIFATAETCATQVISPGEGLVFEVPGEPPPGQPQAPPDQPPAREPLPPQVDELPGVVESTTCESGGLLPTPLTIALVVIALVAPFVVAAVLLRRARARAAAEPPVLRPAAGSGWGALEIAAVAVLGLGSFLAPVVGPAVGLVLAWVSPRWTSQEKILATGLGVATLTAALLLFFLPFAAPGLAPVAFGPVLALVFGALGPLAAAAYLAVVLSGRQVR